MRCGPALERGELLPFAFLRSTADQLHRSRWLPAPMNRRPRIRGERSRRGRALRSRRGRALYPLLRAGLAPRSLRASAAARSASPPRPGGRNGITGLPRRLWYLRGEMQNERVASGTGKHDGHVYDVCFQGPGPPRGSARGAPAARRPTPPSSARTDARAT